MQTDGEDYWPLFSPDGRLLASCSDGLGTIAVRSLVGGGTVERITIGQHLHLTDWSPDGQTILFEAEVERGRWIVRAIDLRSQAVSTLVDTGASAYDGVVSRDGRWLPYSADQSGRLEVYVRPFGREGRAIRVSTTGGRNPEWSRDGGELFYLTGEGLMATTVVHGAEIRPTPPRRLVAGRSESKFDVMPGSREFLLVKNEDERAGPVPLQLHFEWPSELRRRAGADDSRGSR